MRSPRVPVEEQYRLIMELTVGNMKLVVSNGTDTVLLAQTIKIYIPPG